ncbi:MAG: hypothetical protein LCH56_05730 [Proteobacteria bacterium]|nr:hypothetical protein [Pseudomonadota bacterium]
MTWDLRTLGPTAAMTVGISFAVYRRVRRSIGRQPLHPIRMSLRAGILALVCLVCAGLHPTLLSVEAEILGAAVGIALGFYALKHTRLEATAEGKFYTPHPYISLAVAGLFIGRLADRLLSNGFTPGAPPSFRAIGDAVSNPVTLALYFLMAGYHLLFTVGVLKLAREPTAPI